MKKTAFRAIAIGATIAFLAPGAALIGVATLTTPPATGSSVCTSSTDDASPAAAAPVAGELPASLDTRNAHGATVTLDQTQLRRAAAIIAVGKSEDIPVRGQLVALMAALTESSLRVLSNLASYPSSGQLPHDGDGGDHDSLGLFQMRPTAGWGTIASLMDPVWSSRAFYGGPDGPNHGSPRGLLDVRGWQDLSPGAAAQAVEVSAYPDRYAVNEPVAATILSTLSTLSGGSITTRGCGPSGDVPGHLPGDLPVGFPGALIAAAAKQIGTPYVWGGGSYTGPTDGGFDCSGLVMYAAYLASGGRLRLPHYTGAQIHEGQPVAWADKQPGDLIFFSYPGSAGPHHVAIYVGGDRILQAPRTGEDVRYGAVSEFAGQTTTIRRLR